ncbi:MAG TPA: hypothetical protein VE619_08170 [Nitrososphaeraceae archaeon]|nr:hypothetical protein [Nitrososphaeraceae archaeon]
MQTKLYYPTLVVPLTKNLEDGFVKEPTSSDGRRSYSMRFFDSKRGLYQYVLISPTCMMVMGIW